MVALLSPCSQFNLLCPNSTPLSKDAILQSVCPVLLLDVFREAAAYPVLAWLYPKL